VLFPWDAKWVSYALCLVTLVADAELCPRAFFSGSLCSGRWMGQSHVMFGDVGRGR
jgi:hypothetical protein